MKRLDFVDFARGFAILTIVLFHYSQPYVTDMWSKVIAFGGTGVHLFFILSGFGLGISSTKMPAINFYTKRFIKILIPYYLTIIALFFISVGYPFSYSDIKSNLYALGGHILLYKMFDENIIGSYGYHFWFVSIIIQFYLVFPIIVKVRAYLSTSTFLIYSTVLSLTYSSAISFFDLIPYRVFNSFFLQYLWEFNLGIIFGEKYIASGKVFWNQRVIVLTLCSIIGIVLMGFMALYGGEFGRIFNDIPASIGYSSLVVLVYIATFKALIIQNFLVYLGRFSYELYLTHMIIFMLVNSLIIEKIIGNSSLITTLFIVFPISIIFAICFGLLIAKLKLPCPKCSLKK